MTSNHHTGPEAWHPWEGPTVAPDPVSQSEDAMAAVRRSIHQLANGIAKDAEMLSIPLSPQELMQHAGVEMYLGQQALSPEQPYDRNVLRSIILGAQARMREYFSGLHAMAAQRK